MIDGVSIIIPAYNYGRYLPDAIDSALAQQEDCPVPIEVVVVDDDSTDDTPVVCRDYGERIRYIHQTNAGPSASRNTGMREAKYDWNIFLDADDLLPPATVSVMLETHALQEAPRPVIIAGSRKVFDDGNCPQSPEFSPTSGRSVSAKELILRNRFPCTVLANRRILQELGGFDESLAASEDRDMWIRVAARHPVFRLERVVLWNRNHGVQRSRDAQRETTSVHRVLEKARSNPDLSSRVAARIWRQAEAVCAYQEALMLRDAGEMGPARRAMLRSFRCWPLPMPWLDRVIGIRLARERSLLVTLKRSLSGR